MSNEVYIRDAEYGITIPVSLSENGELIVEIASGNMAIEPTIGEPIVVLQNLENESRAGELYLATCANNTLAKDAVFDVSITTGPGIAHRAHVYFRAAAGGDARTYLYEEVTCNGGVACTLVNRNRRSSNTIGLDVRSSPTCSVAGAILLKTTLMPGGVRAWSIGSATAEAAGWLLKPLTTYLYRVENISTSTMPVAIGLSVNREEI
jgi:hypothetical protein